MYNKQKEALLSTSGTKKTILFAPTFSPSLSSAPYLKSEIKNLAADKSYLVVIKFHGLMAKDLRDQYKRLADSFGNIFYAEEQNITKYVLMSDLLISDTSSVVYEFLLLDKPVVTFKSKVRTIRWDDSRKYEGLKDKVLTNLVDDPYKDKRYQVIKEYHPYFDGSSAVRMVQAVESYIKKNGVPEVRALSRFRKYKIHTLFGKVTY